ncbi:MAG: hypothetical protein FJ076_08750 [Cyanobacteria bacterium K_DeepCast_35m_m1_288]|nr:hypothetical protein [Cyanobacteria bacterium K_DeepCast_35m_m1_288]
MVCAAEWAGVPGGVDRSTPAELGSNGLDVAAGAAGVAEHQFSHHGSDQPLRGLGGGWHHRLSADPQGQKHQCLVDCPALPADRQHNHGHLFSGAGLAYAQAGSFEFAALAELPLGAPLVLVLVGLLTKAGVFLNGLWLPRTHAEAPAEVSALLSGVVVGGGALPLLRLEQLNPAIGELLLPIALASAVLGLIYALGVTDAKRLLAWSTLAQMGLVLLAPAAGGLMAFSHGVGKSGLFLTARQWPSRSLETWRQQPLSAPVLLTLLVGSCSIAGLAPLLGYAAKKQLEDAMPPAIAAILLVLSVGSVAVYCRLCRAPLATASEPPAASLVLPWGAWLLMLPLVGGGALLLAEVKHG